MSISTKKRVIFQCLARTTLATNFKLVEAKPVIQFQHWCSTRVRLCISLRRLVTPVMHIPEHLNSTGTLVITWRHSSDCWSLPHSLTNLLTGLQPCYWIPTEPFGGSSSCVTSVLYIITFVHRQGADKSAYLQSAKRSRKESLQSITDKVKRQNTEADKTMCSVKTAFRFDEYDVIQYFRPVKYQCGDIYSNSTLPTPS